MPDAGWKAFERRVAAVFGGWRRGPDVTGGKSDVVHDHFAPEVKLLGRPSFGELLEACRQSERNADTGHEPVAVVKRKRDRDEDALVVQRLSVFREWRLGGGCGE